MGFHVPEECRVQTGEYGTLPMSGNNGMFVVALKNRRDSKLDRRFEKRHERFRIIASDGLGWEHVSVTRAKDPKTPPSWSDMCRLKDVFWDSEDVVVQYHPRKSEYVNIVEGCLHLWRPVGVSIPTPPTYMVG